MEVRKCRSEDKYRNILKMEIIIFIRMVAIFLTIDELFVPRNYDLTKITQRLYEILTFRRFDIDDKSLLYQVILFVIR